MNNHPCLTCKYEPKWNLWSIYNKIHFGYCRRYLNQKPVFDNDNNFTCELWKAKS